MRTATWFFVILSLASLGQAAPLVFILIRALMRVAPQIGTAVARSALPRAFGMTYSRGWFEGLTVINGALYHSTTVAGGLTLAGAIVGPAAYKIDHDSKLGEKPQEEIDREKYLMAMDTKTMTPITNPTSIAAALHSLETIASNVEASIISVISTASEAWQKYIVERNATKSHLVEVSNKMMAERTRRSQAATATKTTSRISKLKRTDMPAPTIPPPPAHPVASLLPHERPEEVPDDIPEYEWRMCQHDMIRMGQRDESLILDNPSGHDLMLSNIPPTCMILHSLLIQNPAHGPHPVAVSNHSLQWNAIDPLIVNALRQYYGLEPRQGPPSMPYIMDEFEPKTRETGGDGESGGTTESDDNDSSVEATESQRKPDSTT